MGVGEGDGDGDGEGGDDGEGLALGAVEAFLAAAVTVFFGAGDVTGPTHALIATAIARLTPHETLNARLLDCLSGNIPEPEEFATE